MAMTTETPQTPPTGTAAEAICPRDITSLVDHHPGIVCVSLPATGTFDIAYDPKKVSRGDVRDFASRLPKSWSRDGARCTLRLQGRACETCAARIEHKLSAIPGIRHATASFLNGSLSVIFDSSILSPGQVVERARAAGAPLELGKQFLSRSQLLVTLDSNRWQTILVSLAGAAIAAGFIVGAASPGSLVIPWIWLFAYVTGGYSGVRASIRSLRMGVMDIDLLMVLAALGAALIGAPAEGAVLLFLFALSNLLQAYAVGRARKAIAALLDLRPEVALVKNGDLLIQTPVEQISAGQVIVLRPGERVALDGDVIAGQGSINQASITGESMPVEKKAGDPVFAGTMNQEGSLEVRVSRPASESTLARMISLVEAAQGEKAQTQRFLERAEQYYAGGVIIFTLLLIAVPPLVSATPFTAAFYRAMAVMVVASPCALILSTPAAILSAIAGLGRRGILVKGGRYLEDAARIKAVALDKTGTLTSGKPQVTDIVSLPDDGASRAEADRHLLSTAAQAELRSEHPLAKAVIAKATDDGLPVPPPQSFNSITGRGGEATLADGTHVVFGSLKLMRERHATRLYELDELVRQLEQGGKTVVCVARTEQAEVVPLGVLGLQDVLRPDAAEALEQLKHLGISRIVMLTGDSAGVANAIAAQAGITEVHAGLMPEDKVQIIRKIAAETPVIMVGDGVNDAPALAAADLGMAMGAAGTDVAMETADVVLMSHDLHQISYFLDVGRKARRVVFQNLIFASGVVVVLLIAALGFELPLTAGVIGHEGSTVLVCLNGLRLLRPLKTAAVS